MTASKGPTLRVISFGDLDGEIWGAALDADRPAIVFATPDGVGSAAGAGSLTVSDQDPGFKLTGERFDLLLTPSRPEQSDREGGAAGRALGEPAGAATGDELTRVSGSLTAADAPRSVQCLGTVSTGAGFDLRRLGSLQGLAGWLGSDRGLALLAMRAAGKRDHGSDAVTATLFAPDGWIAVNDPRLSTTFRAGDRPSSASLELWIGDGEEQYPRRAAAEASGDGAEVSGDGVTLRVTPIRCHASGLDGAGVYLQARF